MTLWTIKADTDPEDDGSANRTIRIIFDQDSGAGIAITEDAGAGKWKISPRGSASNLDIEFNAKGTGLARSAGARVLTTTDSSSFDASGSAAAVDASLMSHAALTTAHGISAFAATLLDDSDAASMRSTLGLGTASTQAANSAPTASTVPISSSDRRLASGWMRPFFFNGPLMSWVHDVGSTTITATGTPVTMAQVGTASVSSQDNSTSPREQHVTGTTSGNAGGREVTDASQGQHQRSWLGGFCARWVMGPNIQNVRHWVALSSAALDQVGTPTTQHVAGFRYDTGVDGTAFWRCVSCDGASNVTTTATSVAVDNDTNKPGGWSFRCEFLASSIEFYIDDVLVATHTTNMPGSTTLLRPKASITTLTGAAKRGSFVSFHVWRG